MNEYQYFYHSDQDHMDNKAVIQFAPNGTGVSVWRDGSPGFTWAMSEMDDKHPKLTHEQAEKIVGVKLPK